MKEIRENEKVKFKKLLGDRVVLQVLDVEFSVPVESVKSFEENYFLFKNFELHFYLNQIRIENEFLKGK